MSTLKKGSSSLVGIDLDSLGKAKKNRVHDLKAAKTKIKRATGNSW